MKNILITGANGLIGDCLVSELSKNNAANIFSSGRHNINNLENFIEVDFSKQWSMEMFPEKMDIIIHLAQSEKFRDFPDSSIDVLNVNTNSTLKLLEYARKSGVKKFIYASSGGVYGNSDIGFNEESPLKINKDLGFYLTTKFCSELLVENYTSFFDINILRFFFVFGEKQKKNMLIPRLIESVRHNKAIQLQGKEGISINPIYVTDAAKAIINITEKQGSYKINIGGKETVSIKQLSETIGGLLNISPVFEYQNQEVKNLIGDISKMQNLYNPSVSLQEALKKMI